MVMGCKMSRCVSYPMEYRCSYTGEAFVLMGPICELGQANASDNGARVIVSLFITYILFANQFQSSP